MATAAETPPIATMAPMSSIDKRFKDPGAAEVELFPPTGVVPPPDCGVTSSDVFASAERPRTSETCTITVWFPDDLGVHENDVLFSETQPAGKPR